MGKFKAKFRLDGQIHVTKTFDAEDQEDAENAALLMLEHAGCKDAEIIRIETEPLNHEG